MQPRIIPRSEHTISRKNIDADALKVLYRLYRSGHTAFLVGGGVRDLLIGRRPKDFDVSTSARPGQVKKLFRNCWLIGRRFRLAHIHFREHKIIEVSTFRAEPQRGEGEGDDDLLVRQDNTFGTPEEDALRRDFTINGLFYDIASFSIIDYVGGVEDLEKSVVRTIGDPHIRFQEDPVRMIRAIKFAARLDFAIEPETWDAICEHAEDIRKCSTARVLEEVARLTEGGALCRSVQLLKASGLLGIVLPEIYEYLQGVPAGPGLRPEGRAAEAAARGEGLEEDLLLHADEDVDHEAQERILGGAPPPEDEDIVEDEDVAEDEESVEEDEAEDTVEDLEPAEAAGEETDADETEAEAARPLELPVTVQELAEATPVYGEESADEEAAGDEDEAEEELALIEGDDEAEESLLTPEGTRVPRAPDRGGLLWRTLSAVDLLIRSGRTLTRPTLFAALFAPVLKHTALWRASRDGGDPDGYVPGLLRPLTASVVITRRDRERVWQIMAAQGKFQRDRRGAVTPFTRKPYFAEALDLYEIAVLASGENTASLEWWRSRYPPVEPAPARAPRMAAEPAGEPRETGDRWSSGRRRRRRGGSRIGRDGGDEAAAPEREREPLRGRRSESSRGERGDRDRGDRAERDRGDRDRSERTERDRGERGRGSERGAGRGEGGERGERGRRERVGSSRLESSRSAGPRVESSRPVSQRTSSGRRRTRGLSSGRSRFETSGDLRPSNDRVSVSDSGGADSAQRRPRRRRRRPPIANR